MPRHNKNPKHPKTTFSILCVSKKRHKSENEALKTAEIQMLQNSGLELSVYKCDTCGFWHLTRSKR
jgi:rubrerythrin